jgi:hypothetical protein
MEVSAGYASDPDSAKLLQALSVSPSGHPPYTLANGVIHLKDRI